MFECVRAPVCAAAASRPRNMGELHVLVCVCVFMYVCMYVWAYVCDIHVLVCVLLLRPGLGTWGSCMC